MSVTAQRSLRLAAGALVMLSVGLIYGWSIFAEPFKEEFGWDVTTLGITFTVLMCFFCLGGMAGARIVKRFSIRIALALALVLVCGGFIGATFTQSTTPFVLYLSYGVFGGFGIGIIYNVVMGALMQWFPGRSGLVSGVLLMAYGISTFLLGSFCARLFDAIGWRSTFLLLAAFLFVMLSFALVVIRAPKPEELVQIPRSTHTVASQVSAHEYTPKQMLKSPIFYLFFLWVVLLCSFGLGVIGHAKQIGADAGATVGLATLMVGIISIGNGGGRVLIGMFSDAKGRGKALLASNFIPLLCGICFLIALITGNVIPLVVASALAGLGMAGIPTMSSIYAAEFFGRENYATNFSIINLAIIPSALLGPSLMSYAMASTGSYFTAIILFLLMSVVALAIALFLVRR